MRPTRIAPVISWQCALLLAAVAGAAGCRINERYLVDRGALLALSSVPDPEREGLVVPAVRERDQVKTRVRAEMIPLAPSAWVSDPVSVRTSVRSNTVTAGAALTVVGSIASILGTTVWLSTRNTGRDGVTDAFIGLSIASEPVMAAGTILWIYGLMQRPQESREGEPGRSELQLP